MATDARSQPWAMILTAGSEADINQAPELIDDMDDASSVLMDKAYDSDALREYISHKGNEKLHPITQQSSGAGGAYSRQLYKKRHRVENFFEKLKRMRRVTTRYDKTDASFMAFVFLACCTLCIRQQFQNTP